MALAGGLQHGPYEEILWLPVAKTDFVPLYKKEIWDVFLDGILSHSIKRKSEANSQALLRTICVSQGAFAGQHARNQAICKDVRLVARVVERLKAPLSHSSRRIFEQFQANLAN